MKQSCDVDALSAYLDGAIDLDDAERIESQLDKDPEARRYVLEAVKTTARLRATLNRVLDEAIPDRLFVASAGRGPRGHHRWKQRSTLFRIAAVLLLVMIGFGSGSLFDHYRTGMVSGVFQTLPERYSQVVHESLEYDRSGTVRRWQSPDVSLTVLVTPIKTFRNPAGTYFREYRLKVVSKVETDQIRGLAYRNASGIWKTKALIF